MRHIAQLIFIDIAKAFIIVIDTALHVTVAFLWHTIFIPDVIHQVMIVMATEIRMDHRIAKWIDLADVIAIAVHDIDVLEAVAIRAHLPERRILHIAKLLWLEKLRILTVEVASICHHRRLVVVALHEIVGKDCGIAPSILEHQVERPFRQRLAILVIVLDIFLRDSHIALVLQC